jgi:hypothetical protein
MHHPYIQQKCVTAQLIASTGDGKSLPPESIASRLLLLLLLIVGVGGRHAGLDAPVLGQEESGEHAGPKELDPKGLGRLVRLRQEELAEEAHHLEHRAESSV